MRVLLLISALLTACGPTLESTLGDCPDGSTVNWSAAGPVFGANCTRCHSSTLSGSDRQAAPEGWDYDTADNAMRDPDRTWLQIYAEEMPNDAEWTDVDEKLLLWEWYSCGGPQ
jgi:hypothetical protein